MEEKKERAEQKKKDVRCETREVHSRRRIGGSRLQSNPLERVKRGPKPKKNGKMGKSRTSKRKSQYDNKTREERAEFWIRPPFCPLVIKRAENALERETEGHCLSITQQQK